MKKYYIKMNEGYYLSLGNVFHLIKEISLNVDASQMEIFCSLFDVNYINSSTVNNYCIGIRAIGLEYKKNYMDLWDNYENNDKFRKIILSLLSILDNKVYYDENIDFINKNVKLEKLCLSLYELCHSDINIDNEYLNKISVLMNEKNYYSCIFYYIYYAVIMNKQPLYRQDLLISINEEELNDYLKVKLYEGVSYINSLLLLSKKNNMYACADLGSLEYSGLISGKVDYDKAFSYYKKAALKDHPKACWMVSNMIFKRKVSFDMDLMWFYLNKAIELGSSAALNTMGLCYLKGINPYNVTSLDKAREYFKLASEEGYTFAFNNLGKIEEESGSIEKAIEYYKISADMGESWALNKMGEYYRKKGDMDKAYIYYKVSSECPINERFSWGEKNLKKYFK